MSTSLKGLKRGTDWWGPSRHVELKHKKPGWLVKWQDWRRFSSSEAEFSRKPADTGSRKRNDTDRRPITAAQRDQGRVLERDFFLSVLNSTVTKRDAKSYISNFDPSKKSVTSKPKRAPGPHEGVLHHDHYNRRRAPGLGVNLGGFYAPIRAVDQTPVFSQQPLPDPPAHEGIEPLHVALVKIRNPHTLDADALQGIGLTLSQLTLLGLSCAVVVDCDDADGSHKSPSTVGSKRSAILTQSDRVVSALCSKSTSVARTRRLDNTFAVSDEGINGAVRTTNIRVTSRDQLLAPLRRGIIPVIPPVAYEYETQRLIAIDANDATLALTRELAGINPRAKDSQIDAVEMASRIASLQKEVSLDKLIILDPLGGIPSVERPNGSHVFINLEQEYAEIMDELACSPLDSASIAVHSRNLKLLKESLGLLPPTSSAIITTPQEAANSSRESPSTSSAAEVSTRRQKNPLIHNLLTDKPVFSSSLPAGRMGHSTLDAMTSSLYRIPTPTTSVKLGMPLTFIPDPRIYPWTTPSPDRVLTEAPLTLHHPSISLPSLLSLLHSSFNRQLDAHHYLSRINPIFAGLIIAGNYEGCCLFTWEHPPGSPPDTAPVAYLDKFAVRRESQGGGKGVADMLFTAMVRTAFPGGVCWRSRRENVVNKWYFERAHGSWDIPPLTGEAGLGNWTMFWTTDGDGDGTQCDARRFSEYVRVCQGVIPSWADTKPAD